MSTGHWCSSDFVYYAGTERNVTLTLEVMINEMRGRNISASVNINFVNATAAQQCKDGSGSLRKLRVAADLMALTFIHKQGEMIMSTVKPETEDTRNENQQRRERGGQSDEDRAKSLDAGDMNPFDDQENDQKQKQ